MASDLNLHCSPMSGGHKFDPDLDQKLLCLTAIFLASGGSSFNCMAYKHAYLNTLLLLHSVFMLSMVKIGLKGKV